MYCTERCSIVFTEKPAEFQYTVPSFGELLLVDFFSVLTYLYPSLFQIHFLYVKSQEE